MRQIRLHSQDYSTVLLTTDEDAVAHQFLRDSGKDWLGMVIDYGNGWQSRWSGRLVLHEGGTTSTVDSREFLNYMITPPNLALEQHGKRPHP